MPPSRTYQLELIFGEKNLLPGASSPEVNTIYESKIVFWLVVMGRTILLIVRKIDKTPGSRSWNLSTNTSLHALKEAKTVWSNVQTSVVRLMNIMIDYLCFVLWGMHLSRANQKQHRYNFSHIRLLWILLVWKLKRIFKQPLNTYASKSLIKRVWGNKPIFSWHFTNCIMTCDHFIHGKISFSFKC